METIGFHNSLSLNWLDVLDVRAAFINYLGPKGYDARVAKDYVSYLDKHAPILSGPFDVISLFAKIKTAKRHVAMSLRVFLNFYEAVGFDKAFLDSLRKALPKVQCGIDLKIPSEERIVDSLQKSHGAPPKYRALYNLLLDSGLRLVEAVELMNSFRDTETINGFYRCELAMFRGAKQAYYGHFTETALSLIKQVNEKLDTRNASHYFQKYGYVSPKYLRKYAFDKMIELDIPESVADFIEGRVPKRIGAKHYLALARQSSKFYPRYAEYLDALRKQL